MGSRIAQGDTAARERIAIASALHRGGQREDWEARRARSGTWEWRRFGLPFLVASQSPSRTLAEPKFPSSEKRFGKLLLDQRKPWSMLGCVVCYLSPSLAGWGLTNPPICSRPGRIGRADVNSIASIAPTLAATLAYAATTRLVAFPATSMVSTDASLVHGAALH